MLEVAGRPFVEHVISHLARFGVRNVILLAGHRGALPRDHYDGRRLFGAELSVLIDPEPLGTAGTLRFAAKHLDEIFLLTNGDTFFGADLLPLLRLAENPHWEAAMLLRRIAGAARYGAVELDSHGAVRAFREKSQGGTPTDALVNACTYLIRRDAILAMIEETPCSLENDLFPRLAAAGALQGFEANGYFVDIGIPEGLEAACRELARHRIRPAAFLDRDGVLNVDHGYTHRIETLEWITGAPAAVRARNRAGYYVIVVSNQAGVARGYYKKEAIEQFHAHMQEMLMKEDAHVDAFYYCPHHPEGSIKEFAIQCDCRKPGTGMLEQAASDWTIDRVRSFLIGDKDSDLAAAAAFHIRGIRFDAQTNLLQDLIRKELANHGAKT
jgi:D,D-heptose 1,7-bisphosphate phosphatase